MVCFKAKFLFAGHKLSSYLNVWFTLRWPYQHDRTLKSKVSLSPPLLSVCLSVCLSVSLSTHFGIPFQRKSLQRDDDKFIQCWNTISPNLNNSSVGEGPWGSLFAKCMAGGQIFFNTGSICVRWKIKHASEKEKHQFTETAQVRWQQPVPRRNIIYIICVYAISNVSIIYI